MLAVIGVADKTGEIKVTLTSKGLPDCVVTLDAVKAEYDSGTSSLENVGFAPTECGRTDEIPVRKIELYTDTFTLDKDNPEITVKYKALPVNSDYAEDIEFRVTNEKGITSNLAECEVTADSIKVKAKGDGSFWLRAMCKTALSVITSYLCSNSLLRVLETHLPTHISSLSADYSQGRATTFQAA